jgi:hypothetical protein
MGRQQRGKEGGELTSRDESVSSGPGVWSDITTAENVLRDLVEETLQGAFGEEWLEKSGLTDERIDKLREAYEEEGRRRDGVRSILD